MMKSILKHLAFLLIPLTTFGQQSLTQKQDAPRVQNATTVSGRVLDGLGMKALSNVTVAFVGEKNSVMTDDQGKYVLQTSRQVSQIRFTSIGFAVLENQVVVGKNQVMDVKLQSISTQLQEVAIHLGKRPRYKNKENPAVSLIQQVIDHKEGNRMQHADYLEYHQYERIGFSLFDLSARFLNSKTLSKYKFLLDTGMVINDSVKTALPVYMSEKFSDVYTRSSPKKTITFLQAHNEVNYSALIDTAALDLYLNRIYGNPDIYANNIFILTNEFLSPIADHAPDFYKFFVTDTIKNPAGNLIEVGFIPRNPGDLLFEGKLYITLDGRYAVKSVLLNLNKHININFVRRMDIKQDFDQYPDGRYYLVKSEIKSDFGLTSEKGKKIYGNRTVFFSDYKLHEPKDAKFYQGKENQLEITRAQKDSGFWTAHRGDTLARAQAQVYQHIDSLQHMPSYKRAVWATKFVTSGYGDIGGFELGPNGSFYSFNPLEGNRVSIGGRTKTNFNRNLYLEGYATYGFRDKKEKYDLGVMYAFNGVSPWGFPNSYLKFSYQYDTDIPGQNFLIDKFQSILGSFTRGSSDLWQYNRIFRANYLKDLENHFSYNVGFKYWQQQPADKLRFHTGNGDFVNILTATELNLVLRYAPHEQIFKGAEHRHTIPNKYPIFTMQAGYGIKGLLASTNDYLSLGANIYKRFYLSQLGYTDVTLLGGAVLGKVPFPLLSIMPANQTYLYDKNAYNNMNFLEFVSDHYVGLNATHSFGGFLLNKVPMVSKLKLREFLSLKVLYGGLSNQNNPAMNPALYRFPTSFDGTARTFALGNTPYAEIGLGIGNIFKVLRVDVIRRIGYLQHSGVVPTGIRFTIGTGL